MVSALRLSGRQFGVCHPPWKQAIGRHHLRLDDGRAVRGLDSVYTEGNRRCLTLGYIIPQALPLA